MRVTTGFFEAWGMEALYGRTFTPEEYTRGRNQVVVLSYGTWAQRFGADRSIVGGTIRLNGQPHTVVGVMSPAFAPRLLVTSTSVLWDPKFWADPTAGCAAACLYNAVAAKPGITVQHGAVRVRRVGARLASKPS